MERSVPELPTFDDDFRFAERCLAGDGGAIADLRADYLDMVHSYIVRSGATAAESAGLIESLFTECIAGPDGARPVLAAYLGQCPLRAWLCRVALNRFVSLKRAAQRDIERFGSEPGDAQFDGIAAPDRDLGEEPVLGLVRDAIVRAFKECDPEQFVILQLLHADELTATEIARMFGCAISTVTRQAEQAQTTLRTAILKHVRAREPWLELTFDDLLAICRTVLPDCFGMK